VGRRSNRDGIGCRVTVVPAGGTPQFFTTNTAVGYLSASDPRLLVGLGPAARASRVEVRWPSGAVSELRDVAAGQTLVVREPAS
jgi:hypothetical protein